MQERSPPAAVSFDPSSRQLPSCPEKCAASTDPLSRYLSLDSSSGGNKGHETYLAFTRLNALWRFCPDPRHASQPYRAPEQLVALIFLNVPATRSPLRVSAPAACGGSPTRVSGPSPAR